MFDNSTIFKYHNLLCKIFGYRCLHFSSGGECLYAGGQDELRVYAWEPARTITSLQIPWGKVQDIASTNDKLVCSLSMLSIMRMINKQSISSSFQMIIILCDRNK